MKKRVGRWPLGAAAVLLLGLWHLQEVQAGAAATGDGWMVPVYVGLLAAAFVGLLALGRMLFGGRSRQSGDGRTGDGRTGDGRSGDGQSSQKQNLAGRAGSRGAAVPLQRIYPAAGLFLGFVYLMVLAPLCGPDEISHYVSAYQLSSRMLGEPSDAANGRVLLRAQDAWVEDLEGVYEYEQDADGNWQVVLESAEGNRTFGEPLDQSVYQLIRELAPDGAYAPERYEFLEHGRVGSMYPPVTTTPLAYVPQALGIAAARLLGLGTLPLLYLGRLCNLVFFVGMTWLAMRRMPFGKEVLFGVALLPMTLHLSATYSYDVMIMGCLFCFTAVCLDLTYRKERVELADVAALAVLMAVAGPCKMIYAVFLGLCLLIPVGKFGGWGKWALAAAAVAGAWLIAMLAVNSQVVVSYATEAESYVTWAEEPGYSFSLMIHQPLRTLAMFYRTILWQAQQYHLTMIGAYLGNLDEVLDVPYLLVVIFTVCLAGLAFRKPGESLEIRGGKRAWILILCAGCAAAAMASMLIAWTPISSRVINGVQGRYFLPFLPVLLLACKNDFVVLTKDRNRSILYLMCCLNGYELLRLFATVSMRL